MLNASVASVPPELVSVEARVLLAPVVLAPKSSDAGDKASTAGDAAVPVSETDTVDAPPVMDMALL